ncbi:MAG: hypothetical protein ACRDR6_24625, partial [Pseudonocardiaceae bacterium]
MSATHLPSRSGLSHPRPTHDSPRRHGRPAAGLYDPAYEHDACGVAFVADLTGGRTHSTVQKALTALRNL